MDAIDISKAKEIAEKEFKSAFAREIGGATPVIEDPVISFQTDTWRRYKDMAKEEGRMADWGLRGIQEHEAGIDSLIESGIEYDWNEKENEVEIVGPISRYGAFTFTFEPPEKEARIISFVRIPSKVNEGVVALNVIVGREEDLKDWGRLQAVDRHEEGDLKPGVYRASMTREGLELNDLSSDLSEVPTIHPKREQVMSEVNSFFDNSEQFTRFGQDGTKKWMLIGPPGTGKTTMMQQLAREMMEEMPCVFATDIGSMTKVQKRAAKADLPVLIFLEDAEQAFKTTPMGGDAGQKGGANSSVLNALDGVDTPTNNNGCAVIMSTNHPGQIEDRILERPGRVDRPVEVGHLNGEYAVRCAQLYLPDESEVSTEAIVENLDGASGDEIRGVCNAAVSLSVSKQKDLDDSVFENAVASMRDQLNAAEEFADQESVLSNRADGPGF